jgi:hypothetical protein
MTELTRNEIDVLSINGNELYAYINAQSLGKEWPDEIEHLNKWWKLEATYNLPAQMNTYVQAAKYFLMT